VNTPDVKGPLRPASKMTVEAPAPFSGLEKRSSPAPPGPPFEKLPEKPEAVRLVTVNPEGPAKASPPKLGEFAGIPIVKMPVFPFAVPLHVTVAVPRFAAATPAQASTGSAATKATMRSGTAFPDHARRDLMARSYHDRGSDCKTREGTFGSTR